jgi:hypothetical protein
VTWITAVSTIGDSPVGVLIYVQDVDAAFAQDVDAGAEVEMPPMDMFWGDRFCKVKDPFGHKWSLATHVEDVDDEEMGKRAAATVAFMGYGLAEVTNSIWKGQAWGNTWRALMDAFIYGLLTGGVFGWLWPA